MAELTPEQLEFLGNAYVGTAVTLRADGSPHATIVWVDASDGIGFNTAVGRAKERHLRRDPRVALLVVDPQNTYKWVSVSGTAELATDGADEQLDRRPMKYLGQETYPFRSAEETRISVRIRPEKVDAAGFGGG